MKLYVANVTKQHFICLYRLPETSQLCAQTIEAGGQQCLTPDFTQQEVDHILAQYDRYGIRDVSNIDEKRDPPFSGICYSIGKPVSVEKLKKGMMRHDQSLDKLGKQIRQEAAVAAQQDIEQRYMRGEAMPKPFDVTVEEVIPTKGLDEDLTHISEGIRVTRNPESNMPVVQIGASRR